MTDHARDGSDVAEERIEFRCAETRLVGHLAVPPQATGSLPGVLVFPEWWGLTEYARERARQLAAEGYIALAADMYGEGITTTDPSEAASLAADTRLGALSRARSTAAFEVLASHPLVDADRIAAIGFCFGGDVTLELARSGAELRGAVAFHASLTTLEPARADDLHAKVLVLHGADDPLAPDERVQGLQDELRAAEADWQLVTYGNAVHGFSNPDAGGAGVPGVAYDEAAARRSWALHLAFLEEVMAPTAANG